MTDTLASVISLLLVFARKTNKKLLVKCIEEAIENEAKNERDTTLLRDLLNDIKAD